MADDVVTYDTVVGGEVVEGFAAGVTGIVSAGTVGASAGRFGHSGGASFDRMRASFTAFQEAVDGRLVEQGRVGGLVDAMVVGVHQRLIETDSTSGK